MTARCFADTNLFLYAASKDPADAGKKAVARALLESKDIAIVAAALELGCETLYSEDLNAGQNYGGVIARNPFANA